MPRDGNRSHPQIHAAETRMMASGGIEGGLRRILGPHAAWPESPRRVRPTAAGVARHEHSRAERRPASAS